MWIQCLVRKNFSSTVNVSPMNNPGWHQWPPSRLVCHHINLIGLPHPGQQFSQILYPRINSRAKAFSYQFPDQIFYQAAKYAPSAARQTGFGI